MMKISIYAKENDKTFAAAGPGEIAHEPIELELTGTNETILQKIVVLAVTVGAAALDDKTFPDFFDERNEYIQVRNPFFKK